MGGALAVAVGYQVGLLAVHAATAAAVVLGFARLLFVVVSVDGFAAVPIVRLNRILIGRVYSVLI